MVAIIDYGMGNIHSVQKALEFMGERTIVTEKPDDIKKCDKIVLPGVGAFDDAVTGLERHDLISAILRHVKSKKLLLGICLGMHLLFEESEEADKKKGMGLLKGGVSRFALGACKVPHIGWNQIKKVTRSPGHQRLSIVKGHTR